MIPINELLLFSLAAFFLAISPGPVIIFLVSRSITQGKKAGVISLIGVNFGFLFHIFTVSFGLTAVLYTVPMAYTILKTIGVFYLLYLAFQAINPNSKGIFENQDNLSLETPSKLFRTGLLTNVLNPKTAIFYLSIFSQFIKPEYGSIFTQSIQLGITQIVISFFVNLIFILTASKISGLFSNNPAWVKGQKWFMASVFTSLAIKMAYTKAK